MSFSRWSNSRWYTFWASTSSNKRDEQVFEICGTCSFTYKELKEELDKCLFTVYHKEQEVYPFVDDDGPGYLDYTATPTIREDLAPSDDEMNELKSYIQRFIDRIQSDTELEGE